MPEKKHGKRYRALAEKIERGHEYPPEEGVKLVKETSQAKFDTTVELHLRMGVDPKHADQMVRGAPHEHAGPEREARPRRHAGAGWPRAGVARRLNATTS